jgi:sugar lactone lactonase YvrE
VKILDRPAGVPGGPTGFDPEVVIREARRRQHRRWVIFAVLVVLVVLSTTLLLVLGGRGAKQPRYSHSAKVVAPHHVGTGTLGGQIAPQRPEALALAPDGGIYIADDIRNQVLERLPDGRFRVVAGSGAKGYSGDGGAATKAEIDDPGGMAVSSHGTLYFADSGNDRIRAVSPTGVITTVAGDGQDSEWVADGTPALDASLTSPTAVAFSPTGLLYIADSQQVLALETNGTLTNILGSDQPLSEGLSQAGSPADTSTANTPSGLAFDSTGNLFVSGFEPKTLLMVTSQGSIAYPLGTGSNFYAQGMGDLVTAPDGSVLGLNESSLVHLSPQGAQIVHSFPQSAHQSFLGVSGFSPNGIAVGPDGTIYVDTFSGNGNAEESAIAAIAPNGQRTLLWTSGART